MALLDGTVSQLLIKLSRTVKCQNGVILYFQSIKQHYDYHSRENASLLGLFPQFLCPTKKFLLLHQK